jgi:hypothetical protein
LLKLRPIAESEFKNASHNRLDDRCRSDRLAVAGRWYLQQAPVAQFKPKTALEEQLKSQGLTVRQIKVEGGCYEVYAVDKAGKKVNAAYNAETLEKLANAEAGEN